MLADFEVLEELEYAKPYRLYRAARRADARPVLLKMCSDNASVQQRAALKREQQILNSLPISGVLRAEALIDQSDVCALVLEDPGGTSLRSPLRTGGINIERSLRIARQVAEILVDLQVHGVVHNNIGAHTIWVDSADTRAWLTDFDCAAKDSEQAFPPARMSERSLAYVSPEQTGRMNRKPDYRTDFYSLGVTLYQMLTHRLPFESSTPMELVHCHIAIQPVPPHSLNTAIPGPLSDLVMKLMAKVPEERYRSASGLAADLGFCLQHYQDSATIPAFELGTRDISSRFQVSQRLYGRDREIAQLLRVYERVSAGEVANALVLVSGYSGIGKTSLISEVQRPLVRDRGYFTSGKFEQLRRNVPYSSLIQAFQSLVQQLLAESEVRVAEWRARLLRALGDNGQVIVEIIPQVEMIIGPQPPVPVLGPAENQNRFNRVFLAFSEVFSQPEHPLILFLDDLQWADIPTLGIIRLMLTSPGSRYLMAIGAYRDNEVDPTHPLAKLIAELRNETNVEDIALSPLSTGQVDRLIADSFSCGAEDARPLAAITHEKTKGNPFFVKMFLQAVYRDRLITFDHSRTRWTWSLAHMQALDISDNVVDLMVRRIRQWPREVQFVLSLAAAIGNQFRLSSLCLINNDGRIDNEQAIKLLEADGLVIRLPIGEREGDGECATSFRFLHDRVQQAAYSLIEEADRPLLHLRIGRLLLQTLSSEELEERKFEVVDHLNLGVALLANTVARRQLADLNLAAARKAKLSSAYEPAFKYICAAMWCLSANSWNDDYDITFACHLEKGELEYLLARWDQAIATFDEALRHVVNLLDRCRVNQYKVTLYRAKNELRTSLFIALEALRDLGIDMLEPDDSQLEDDLQRFHALTAVDDAALLNLPELEDPHKLAAMLLLREAMNAAFFVGSRLLFAISMKMVEITIGHGSSPHAAVAFIYQAAFMLAGLKLDFDKAHRFGKLAMRLNEERYRVKPYEAIILDCSGGFISHHTQDVEVARKELDRGYDVALQHGMYTWAGYCAINWMYMSFWGPESLDNVTGRIEKMLPWLKRFDQSMADYFCVFRSAIRKLVEPSAHWSEPSAEWPDAENVLRSLHDNGDRIGLLVYATTRLSLANWYGDPQRAQEYAAGGEGHALAGRGMFLETAFHFHKCLAYAAAFDRSEPAVQRAYLESIQTALPLLERWAQFSPATYSHCYLLIKAELARIQADLRTAMDLYDQAIDDADANGFLQNAALGNELAGRFYLTLKRPQFAQIYLRRAHAKYVLWGARHKARELARSCPGLIPPPRAEEAERADSAFDMSAVIRASQAISEELVLQQLLKKLLTIAIENAGAERGFLLLTQEGALQIEAEGSTVKDEVLLFPGTPVEPGGKLAMSIVNYVRRTGESLVLNNASDDSRFAADEYVRRRKPKSVLCLPILRRRTLLGILYLQNDLASDAFTPERTEVMRVLLAQAAISLETARVYDEMQEEVAERKRAELSLQHAHDDLEVRVRDRTHDLSSANDTLQREILERMQAEEALEHRLALEDAIAVISTRFINVRRDDFGPAVAQALERIGGLLGSDRSYVGRFSLDGLSVCHDYDWPVAAPATEASCGDDLSRAGCRWLYDKLLKLELVSVERLGDLPAEAAKFGEQLRAGAVRSTICIPLSGYAEHSVGFLGFETLHRERAWAPEDVKLLRTFGEILANAFSRQRDEQLLREARDAAETASRAKSGFLANMSHELRTPLNAILGYAQVLQRYANLGAKQRSQAKIIEQSGSHLLTLINDVLDLSKIEAGRMEVETVDYDLAELLRDVANIMRVRAEEADLAFGYETAPCMPQIVSGDARKLRQVLLNLLGNAVKFTTRGSVRLRATWRPRESGAGMLRLEVEDTGAGIGADKLEEIFLPFSQLRNAGQVVEGTGLGLAISRRLVQLMQGDISVTSRPGQGCVFAIELPLGEVQSAPSLTRVPGTPDSVFGIDGRGRRVLVVDDSPENRSVLVAMLEPLGFAVTEASDGAEAQRKAHAQRPELILMDVVMPEVDGLEATRRIRKIPDLAGTIIIAVTARAFEQDRSECLNAGCDDVIAKPVYQRNLLEKVAAHLRIPVDGPVGRAEVHDQSAANAKERTPTLPRETAEELFELASTGDIINLVRLVDQAERIDPSLADVVRKVRILADRYDMRGIRTFVRQYITGNE